MGLPPPTLEEEASRTAVWSLIFPKNKGLVPSQPGLHPHLPTFHRRTNTVRLHLYEAPGVHRYPGTRDTGRCQGLCEVHRELVLAGDQARAWEDEELWTWRVGTAAQQHDGA